MILGTREFIDRVIALVDKSGQRYDLLKKTGVVMTANPELVVNMVGIEYKKTPKDIVTTGERKNEARNVAIYIIRKHCELSNREIAEMFGGLKESAISKVVKRMEQKLRINKELERRINKLVSNVKA
ncbi:MAG: hypothetical protein GWN56_12985 [Nitrosopumilaceae archaeon]|nr:hypothetical protein [Nitrosopumilaceae archaeon]